jgi:hypothetical protein
MQHRSGQSTERLVLAVALQDAARKSIVQNRCMGFQPLMIGAARVSAGRKQIGILPQMKL